ncbi:MAG: hypothetical protein NT007_08520 [Candidatus Kapabacteria bacterium]|nr:hypothetical protein [Candidatus Kapabacteria bacterium]
MIRLEQFMKPQKANPDEKSFDLGNFDKDTEKYLKEVLKDEMMRKIEANANRDDEKFTRTLRKFLAEDEIVEEKPTKKE